MLDERVFKAFEKAIEKKGSLSLESIVTSQKKSFTKYPLKLREVNSISYTTPILVVKLSHQHFSCHELNKFRKNKSIETRKMQIQRSFELLSRQKKSTIIV